MSGISLQRKVIPGISQVVPNTQNCTEFLKVSPGIYIGCHFQYIRGLSVVYPLHIPNRLCLSQAYTKLILFVSEKRTQIGNPQPTWARSNTLLIGHTNIYLFLESAGAGAGFWAPSAPLVRWRRQPPALPRSRFTARCATPRRKRDVCFRIPSWDLR